RRPPARTRKRWPWAGMLSRTAFRVGSILRMTSASQAACHSLPKATTGAPHGGTSPTCATTAFVAGSIRLTPVPVWLVTHSALSATTNHAAPGTGIRASSRIEVRSKRRTSLAWMSATQIEPNASVTEIGATSEPRSSRLAESVPSAVGTGVGAVDADAPRATGDAVNEGYGAGEGLGVTNGPC